jgi:hypothetical protein
VVVEEVPGTHITMMTPPHVVVLGQRLRGILALTDATSGILPIAHKSGKMQHQTMITAQSDAEKP